MWISKSLLKLDPTASPELRLQDMMALWDYETLKPEARTTIDDLRPWEFPTDRDFTGDTIYELYRTAYVVHKCNASLGLDLKTWLSQPRYMCDRDLAILVKCDKLRSDALDKVSTPNDILDE